MFRVESIEGDYATVRTTHGTFVGLMRKVKLSRFKPKNYTLVLQPEVPTPAAAPVTPPVTTPAPVTPVIQ